MQRKRREHSKYSSLALARELAAGDRVREDTSSKLLLHVPLGGTLSLPGPVEPASTLLIGIKLGLDELAETVTIALGEIGDVAGGLAIAGAESLATLVASIVASTDALAVQVLSAVGHGTSPLADHRPLVTCNNVRVGEAASVCGVLLGGQSEEAGVEDLVVVSVHHDIPDASGLAHESVPGLGGHETVVENDSGVLAGLTGDSPGVIVVLLEAVLVDATRDVGLVKSLDSSDNVSITSVALGQSLQSSLGVVDVVALLPRDVASLAAVIEAVLRSGG